MGCGRNCVHSLGNHTRLGYVVRNLHSGQMSAYARLCALTHLNLYGGGSLEVLFVHAEPARSHLDYGVLAVLVEVAVQTAFTGVVVDAQLLGGAGERLVRVIGDGAVAHRREHYGRGQLELRGQIVYEHSARVPLYLHVLFGEVYARLHRLAQRVYGRVGYLRGVYQYLIEIYGVFRRVAHGREQHAARRGLTVYLVHGSVGPVVVELVGIVALDYLERVRGTHAYAPVAVYALGAVGNHLAQVLIVLVHLVGALTLAHPTGYAKVGIAHYFIFGGNKYVLHLSAPSRMVNMTG